MIHPPVNEEDPHDLQHAKEAAMVSRDSCIVLVYNDQDPVDSTA